MVNPIIISISGTGLTAGPSSAAPLTAASTIVLLGQAGQCPTSTRFRRQTKDSATAYSPRFAAWCLTTGQKRLLVCNYCIEIGQITIILVFTNYSPFHPKLAHFLAISSVISEK